MAKNFAAMILALLATTICLAVSPAKPEKSEYLVTEGGGFILKRGEGVMYALTFVLRKELTAPLYATISFENPSDQKSPFVIQATLQPDQHELKVASPSIPRIKNGTTYEVEILLFSDEARTKRVGKHDQGVLFNMPPDAVRAFGVELI